MGCLKAWHIVDGTKEYQCEFVSVNVLKKRLWLRLNGKVFFVEYESKTDYNYAKRGELMRGLARNKSNIKSIKFIFK